MAQARCKGISNPGYINEFTKLNTRRTFLKLLADGLTNQTSAERLMLSARTSQGHSNNLYHKLKDTIWTRSMSAFLKSNFLNSNDASTIRRQNGSNNSLSVTLQLTLVSADRVGGRVTPSPSHNTVHAVPHTAFRLNNFL